MTNSTADSFNSSLMMGWIKDMSGFGPRRAGSMAGHQTEDYLIDKLSSFGLESIRKEPIPITYRETTKAIFEINEGNGFKAMDAFPIPFSAYTPDEGIEASLVYADPAKFFQGGNWKGKVVVTDISFPMLDVKQIAQFSFGKFDPQGNMFDIRHPATWVRIN